MVWSTGHSIFQLALSQSAYGSGLDSKSVVSAEGLAVYFFYRPKPFDFRPRPIASACWEESVCQIEHRNSSVTLSPVPLAESSIVGHLNISNSITFTLLREVSLSLDKKESVGHPFFLDGPSVKPCRPVNWKQLTNNFCLPSLILDHRDPEFIREILEGSSLHIFDL